MKGWEGHPNYRWTRMIDGTRHRVTCEELGLPKPWTKETTYAAWQEWLKARLAALSTDPLTETYRATVGLPSIDEMKLVIEKAAIYKSLISTGPDAFPEPGVTISGETVDEIIGIGDLEPERRIELLEVIGAKLGGTPTPSDLTLRSQTDRWLEEKKTETRPKSYKNIVFIRNRWFNLDFLGATKNVKEIDAEAVRSFKLWAIGSGLSDSQQSQQCLYFRAFVKWLWRSETLDEVPRCLDGCRVDVKAKTVPTIPLKAVRTVLASLKNDFHRMYALFVLNTGGQNNDIGRLRKDQIDGNILTMKRGKTGDSENVPEVRYRLWPETLALLTQFKSKDPTLYLLSSSGTPLYDSRYEAGEPKNKDLVGQQWRRAGYDLTLDELRKVPAQQLEDNRYYAEFVAYFLGHSANGITRSHYAPESQKRFFKACDWLRGQILGK